MQVTEAAPEDPLQLSRTTLQQQTAIIAFTARYYSGMPFQVLACACHSHPSVCPGSVHTSRMCMFVQEPVTVLLKEYLPAARSVACNELQALVHLMEGLPSRKWHAASAPLSADPPIVPILGVRDHPIPSPTKHCIDLPQFSLFHGSSQHMLLPHCQGTFWPGRAMQEPLWHRNQPATT